MGLLSRMARRAGAFADGASERMADRAYNFNYGTDRFAPLSSAASGALGGGFIGSIADQENPGRGALMGAGLGAAGGLGASLARQGAAGMRAGLQGMRSAEPAIALDAVKQEALQYVRNSPQATQAVMQAQTPQEIAQIVDAVITRSRSRMTEGGF